MVRIETTIDCTEPHSPAREHHVEFDAAGSRRRSFFARRDAACKNDDVQAVDTIADTGHRVRDFPHAIDKAGNLGDFGDFDGAPATGPWILEIRKRASDTAVRRAL